MESSCGERGGFGGFGGCGGERCFAALCANLARAGVRPGGGWGMFIVLPCSSAMRSESEPGTELTFWSLAHGSLRKLLWFLFVLDKCAALEVGTGYFY